MSKPRQAAVFLDRDGTLMEEVDYCRDPELVRLLPSVVEGLERLRHGGFALVVVTNQSGIGRGRISLAEYEAVHARLVSLLPAGILAATYFCPDHPDMASDRRKPGPGMVREAARDLHLDLAASWLVGDKESDVQCAQAAGVCPILVQTGYGREARRVSGVLVAEDFAGAVAHILERRPRAPDM